MEEEYIFIGKIVNTHGIKGELRLLSNFKYKNKVFLQNRKIYIGEEKKEEMIKSYRHHKIFEMIMMDGYNDIDQVLKYKGDYVFVNKEDIILKENEYLDEDIIGLTVIDGDNIIGKIKRIDNHNGNEVLIITGDREYLIPYNFNFIDKIDLNSKKMYVKNISGLC
jgi:16S rRNA processing protein RimM